MQSPNVAMTDNKIIHYANGNNVSGGWYGGVDERDGFISWLRGEFAAANAIIDSLCHHLKSSCSENGGGEYDEVIGSIQNRRCNWNGVLHMQQYFSVAEVVYALQQVALRRGNRKRSAGGGFRAFKSDENYTNVQKNLKDYIRDSRLMRYELRIQLISTHIDYLLVEKLN
ncbi:hypothetical protein Tco_1391521 [Tanacetum coccineum]